MTPGSNVTPFAVRRGPSRDSGRGIGDFHYRPRMSTGIGKNGPGFDIRTPGYRMRYKRSPWVRRESLSRMIQGSKVRMAGPRSMRTRSEKTVL